MDESDPPARQDDCEDLETSDKFKLAVVQNKLLGPVVYRCLLGAVSVMVVVVIVVIVVIVVVRIVLTSFQGRGGAWQGVRRP